MIAKTRYGFLPQMMTSSMLPASSNVPKPISPAPNVVSTARMTGLLISSKKTSIEPVDTSCAMRHVMAAGCPVHPHGPLQYDRCPRHAVDDMDAVGRIVGRRSDMGAVDAVAVPVVAFECPPGALDKSFRRITVIVSGIEPAPASLVVQAAGPLPVGGIDLGLVAEDLVRAPTDSGT